MTPTDDPHGDMRRDDLDPDLADRLFGGELHPADVPEGLVGVVALVLAAGGPPANDELAAARTTVQAMTATTDAAGVTPVGRKPVFLRAVHTRAAALVALSALGVGAAAAAVTASGRSQGGEISAGAASSGPAIVVTVADTATTGGDSSTTTGDTSATTETTAATPTAGSLPDEVLGAGVGPDATGPAAFGLCVAWTAQGGQVDPASQAFQNLEEAAGGDVAAYCAEVIANGPPPDGRPRLGQSGDAKTGPPADVPGATAPGRTNGGGGDGGSNQGGGGATPTAARTGPPAGEPGPPASAPGRPSGGRP